MKRILGSAIALIGVAVCALIIMSGPSRGEVASHYGAGDGYYGKPVACKGVGMHRPGRTTAHKTLPCGTKVHVTNVKTGKSVTVTVTDRGPFIKGRTWDLNSSAAREIGCGGICQVKAVIGGKAEIEEEVVPIPRPRPVTACAPEYMCNGTPETNASWCCS